MNAQTRQALFEQLHASENGLTNEDARQRLAQSGPNEPSGAKRRGIVAQILGMFTNPLVLILLIASLATDSDETADAVTGRLRV